MTKPTTSTEKSIKERDNTKKPPPITSITQLLRIDLGRSVGVTIQCSNQTSLVKRRIIIIRELLIISINFKVQARSYYKLL